MGVEGLIRYDWQDLSLRWEDSFYYFAKRMPHLSNNNPLFYSVAKGIAATFKWSEENLVMISSTIPTRFYQVGHFLYMQIVEIYQFASTFTPSNSKRAHVMAVGLGKHNVFALRIFSKIRIGPFENSKQNRHSICIDLWVYLHSV